MSSSINDFKNAILVNGGFARPNRFAVSITDVPGFNEGTEVLRELSFMCDSVTIPGKQITTLDYEISTRRALKIPTGFIDDDITLTFNLTNNYLAKQAFDAWTNYIIDVEDYLTRYHDEYTRDIVIKQLDERDRETYSVLLQRAYPYQIASVELGHENESSIQKVSVTLTCDRVVPIPAGIVEVGALQTVAL
jgi:hypothetical protein